MRVMRSTSAFEIDRVRETELMARGVELAELLGMGYSAEIVSALTGIELELVEYFRDHHYSEVESSAAQSGARAVRSFKGLIEGAVHLYAQALRGYVVYRDYEGHSETRQVNVKDRLQVARHILSLVNLDPDRNAANALDDLRKLMLSLRSPQYPDIETLLEEDARLSQYAIEAPAEESDSEIRP